MVEAQTFLSPVQVTHKQYEALRAYYVDGLSPAFLTNRAIALNKSFTKSKFEPGVPFYRQTTVCCWSCSLHQNQLEFEQKAIYLA